ncbi:coenzyme F420 hydrogenase/dehydrogenase beta subunit N-terminal domain-containing protein [Amycolatopsis thermoflava]|uniref:coenzyme F420 hydrogenase/dehydrogenase beta subunit N-terminal domain-containing protein n=1 Tax=Amycolatopsis thermoflava TaxID=84480 RepID=UPI000F4B0632|nr:coenzyme F420 hydrogenase/dehydrogenase beta subunit N-terminal domain-containing protein [Amycolatopsis thermoflava]
MWGPIREFHRAWSAESVVRHHAAAGGTLTGLGRYPIAGGEVDAIPHVRAPTTTPWLTEATISRTGVDMYGGAQSRYGPLAPPVHVKQLLDGGERFAVVAKPRDVSAIRTRARMRPAVNRAPRGRTAGAASPTTASDGLPAGALTGRSAG